MYCPSPCPYSQQSYPYSNPYNSYTYGYRASDYFNNRPGYQTPNYFIPDYQRSVYQTPSIYSSPGYQTPSIYSSSPGYQTPTPSVYSAPAFQTHSPSSYSSGYHTPSPYSSPGYQTPYQTNDFYKQYYANYYRNQQEKITNNSVQQTPQNSQPCPNHPNQKCPEKFLQPQQVIFNNKIVEKKLARPLNNREVRKRKQKLLLVNQMNEPFNTRHSTTTSDEDKLEMQKKSIPNLPKLDTNPLYGRATATKPALGGENVVVLSLANRNAVEKDNSEHENDLKTTEDNKLIEQETESVTKENLGVKDAEPEQPRIVVEVTSGTSSDESKEVKKINKKAEKIEQRPLVGPLPPVIKIAFNILKHIGNKFI
jgi:hypothetical protein